GRVEVDKGRGSMEECLDYLEGGTKEKALDPEDLEVHKAPPPGHYYCYFCKGYKLGLDCPISHPTGEGVCYRCWHIYREFPGEWVYEPRTQRCWYKHDLKERLPLPKK
ncbi:hypothetical protein, partial [Rheinheimera sp.]|uniref:hypothetical protein n=1 Tax=Rheinheimera sp. TaxID=1869214 RepID=UPI0040477BC6